jgi:endonuclease YncB( thermonuclease family)
MESKVAAVALFAALITTPAAAQQRVIDGDTIVLDGTHWRLWGIDAPESRQTCKDGWQAGVEAKHELEQLMAREPVRCEDRGHDRYKRSIGLCRADGEDLGAETVSSNLRC